MTTFQFIAKDSVGHERRGTVDAGDCAGAIAAIRAHGLFPTADSEVKGAPWPAKAAAKTYASDNPGMRFVLPIGCTGWAIASGYCGLFSIIPFLGILLALLSIIFGIVAMVVIRHNPHKHGVARIVIGWIFSFLSLFGHAVACFSGPHYETVY